MAGTSNFGSWVSTHTASRGPSVGPTAVEQPVGPVDDDLVGHREAPLGGEHLAGVAHGDVVAEHLGHADQRRGEVDGAEDQHAGRRGEALDEDVDGVLVGLALRRRSGARRSSRPPARPARRGRRRGRGRGRRGCRAGSSPGRTSSLVADARPVDHGGQRRPAAARAGSRGGSRRGATATSRAVR